MLFANHAGHKGQVGLPSGKVSDGSAEAANQLPYNPGRKGLPRGLGNNGPWKQPSLDGTDRVPGCKGEPGRKGV